MNGLYQLRTLWILILCLSGPALFSQFKLAGNAEQTSETCYLLTKDERSQIGAAINREKIDVRKDFTVNVRVNFGNRNSGGDGMAFVMMTDTMQLLGSIGGHGIGYNDLKPTLIVEFDTYQNTVANDPAYDHIGMMIHGNPDHSASVAGPFAFINNTNNVEDGNWHTIVITWKASTQEFGVYFDCVKVLGYVGPISFPFLDGATTAFWGFTASTGNAYNEQKFCLNTPSWQPILEDLTFCDPTVVTLDANSDGRTGVYYQWSPNSYFPDPFKVKQEILVSDTTTFYLEKVTTCGQHYKDSITVNIRPNTIDFDLGADTVLCEGASMTLTVPQPNLTYEWSTGATSQSISVFEAGTYYVTASDVICSKMDTITIDQSEYPEISLPSDTTICNGSTFIVTATTNADLVRWQDGSLGKSFTIRSEGSFFATAINDCGESTDDIYIETKNCDQYFIPNIFSPNSDGINDYFGPTNSDAILMIERLAIFDRWGALIFEAKDILPTDERKMWDGTFKGQRVNPGTYVYLIRLKMINDEVITAKGSVNVVR